MKAAAPPTTRTAYMAIPKLAAEFELVVADAAAAEVLTDVAGG